MKGFARGVALLLCVLFAAAACSGCANTNKEAVQYVIGVSQANMREPWRLVLMREIQEEAAKHPNIRLVVTDATQDSAKQKADIERLLGYGIDLLIVSPCNAEDLTPTVSEVYRKIPVIVLDRAVEGYDYSLFIGPDNARIGKQAGDAILDLFNLAQNKGLPYALYTEQHPFRVLEVAAYGDSPATVERSAGFSAELARFKAVEIRRLSLENQLRDTAEDAVMANADLLRDVNAVLAHSDDIALGVSRALKRLNLAGTVRVVGIDGYSGENGGLDMVRKGTINQVITSPTGGREAVRYALEILDSVSGVPKQVILRSHSVTQADVESYERSLNPTLREVTEPIRVGYVQVGHESSWRLANNASIQEAARDFGVVLTAIDADQVQERQIEAVRKFIREKMNVIVISPVVSTGWDEVLQEAADAGIPVLLSDRSIEVTNDDLFMTFIGADFREEGRRAMRWILKNVPADKSVRIMELQGTLGATPTEERNEGFAELLDKNRSYRIVYSKGGDFTFEGGKQIVTDYLKTHPWDIDVIFAHNDDMALGAIAALEENGLHPGTDCRIVSVDGTRAALKAITAGTLNCSVECSPLLGPQLMKAVTDLMEGEELPLRIITNEIVFTADNAKSELPGRKY